MMISCQEVITELWDYLDGELPAERAAAIAEHLAECARCYPQYRFEYAFLSAVARQRGQSPAPSTALVEKVEGAVLANTPSSAGYRREAARARGEARRAIPRAAAPLSPRAPSNGPLGPAERWALVILRASLGLLLLLGIGKLPISAEAAAASSTLLSAVATLEGILAAFIVIGVGRRWSYGAALLVHVGSMLFFWGQLRDPWAVALAGLPVCGALIALYLLRDRDAWALDRWLVMRHSRSVAG